MSPLGSVSFLTMIFEAFVFVKVQVTVSPAATAIVACRPVSDEPPDGSTHVMSVRLQPVGSASSDTWYVLGGTETDLAAVPSASEKVSSAVPGRSVPVKPKSCCSPAGCVTLSMISVPFFVFVKVQVTVSPAATAIVACRPVSDEPPDGSTHVMSVRLQPVGSASSDTWYVLGGTETDLAAVPSASEKVSSAVPGRSVPVKPKSCCSPAGFVTLSMISVPFFVFVKVQVTVSPAATAIVACRPVSDEPPDGSTHVMSVRLQPVGSASSDTWYVLGGTETDLAAVPSASEKVSSAVPAGPSP